jgi:hypothetical protein
MDHIFVPASTKRKASQGAIDGKQPKCSKVGELQIRQPADTLRAVKAIHFKSQVKASQLLQLL